MMKRFVFQLATMFCFTSTQVKADCVCGVASSGGVTPQAQFPWLAEVLIDKGTWTMGCGAALINDRYLISGAFCLSDIMAKNVKAVLADQSYDNVTNGVAVSDVKVHKKYNSTNNRNDISLIKLKTPLNLATSTKIKPVCLPTNVSQTYEGDLGVTAQWQRGGSSYSLFKMPVLNSRCDGYTTTVKKITKSMICVGVQQGQYVILKSPGSPLVVKEGGKYEIAGVAVNPKVFSIVAGHAIVYTRITKYMGWILKNTADAQYC